MAKDLERDLGLPSVLAISIGAMVGSGIFILPALAMKQAGPAVVLAYAIAAILVLPAALSKAEMATAMPEAGGTYVYIERGMGPLLGTIAGLGTWFALSFKGALALVGGVPYLLILVDLPKIPVALGLAGVLILVNLFGAKQTGRLQVGVVVVMLLAMVWFVAGSAGSVSSARFEGFTGAGGGGILAATGLVFVSYAGVTKIASVAEEVEDPGRVIPIGMIGSLTFTTLLYVLVVAIVVGVADPTTIIDSEKPIADVAEVTMANFGVLAVVAAALLALVSTANAGLLSSSRYPFAMSRDQLAPPSLAEVSERFGTPSNAITLTGAVMLGLIAFVPVLEIAKLASAFQILVFVLVNVALVAFRESDAEYDPEFTSPLYPWLQAFGVVGGLVLLTQMGWIPMVGSVVIVGGSTLWYFAYAHRRVDREGVATDVVRRGVGRRTVERTRSALDEAGERDVLVAITEDVDRHREAALLAVAADVAADRGGHVVAVQFDSVPDQTPLDYASTVQSETDVAFERRTDDIAADLDVPVEHAEIVSHDPGRALVNAVDDATVDLAVLDRNDADLTTYLDGGRIGRDVDCDVLLVDAAVVDEPDSVTLFTTQGPFDPTKVDLANAIAAQHDADLRLVHHIPGDAPDERLRTIEDYHVELAELCTVPVTSHVVDADEERTAITDTDLVLVDDDRDGMALSRRRNAIDRETPAIEVRPRKSRQPGLLGRLLERRTL